MFDAHQNPFSHAETAYSETTSPKVLEHSGDKCIKHRSLRPIAMNSIHHDVEVVYAVFWIFPKSLVTSA